MAMELHKLSEEDKKWFVEVAAVAMLVDELKRPDMVNIPYMTEHANLMIEIETAWVVKKDGVCVGAVGSLLLPNMFNPNIQVLTEVFWYVLPEYRNTRAGYLLLKALEGEASDLGVELTLSTLPTSQVRGLEKRGYVLAEHMYRKVI